MWWCKITKPRQHMNYKSQLFVYFIFCYFKSDVWDKELHWHEQTESLSDALHLMQAQCMNILFENTRNTPNIHSTHDFHLQTQWMTEQPDMSGHGRSSLGNPLSVFWLRAETWRPPFCTRVQMGDGCRAATSTVPPHTAVTLVGLTYDCIVSPYEWAHSTLLLTQLPESPGFVLMHVNVIQEAG